MASIGKIPPLKRVFPTLAALCLSLMALAGIVPRLGWSGPGSVVLIDESPSCEPPLDAPLDAIAFTHSDLGAALGRVAADSPGRAVRLYTDGCSTGEAPIAFSGLRVDVVLRPRRDNVRLAALRAPARVHRDRDFALDVVVGRTAGADPDPREVVVSLRRDGERVGDRHRLRLARGQRGMVRIRDRVDTAGLVRYRALVESGIGDRSDDEREILVRVGDRALVAWVAPSRPDRELRPDREMLDVILVRNSELERFLARPGVVARLDAVLLSGGVPGAAAQELLARAVERGLGLVLLGGEGYAGRPLERVLPLTDQPPGGRALVLAVDLSGSMAPRRTELERALGRLRDLLAPSDRVALVVFRDRVVRSTGWTGPEDAAFDLGQVQPRGNTRLGPALREALALFRSTRAGERRLIVLSDGKWHDGANRSEGSPAFLVRELDAAGIDRAALFLGSEVPGNSRALFPRSLDAAAGEDLRAALFSLEREAPGRFLAGPVPVVRGVVHDWLASALPPAGPYRSITRLYPRNVGERVALHGGGLPLVAGVEVGGRAVVVAADASANEAVRDSLESLLLAVRRPDPEVALRAWRVGRGLVCEARGPRIDTFQVDGISRPALPVGPNRWRAGFGSVSAASLRVACRGAEVSVPSAEAREQAGLVPCRAIAADLARRSGGRFYDVGEAPALERRPVRAYWLALLGAVVAVLLSAWLRRKS